MKKFLYHESFVFDSERLLCRVAKNFALLMILWCLSSCNENSDTSHHCAALDENINFLMSSIAFEGDKAALEEIRYIIELTEKISDSNQRFLAFAKNFGTMQNICFLPEQMVIDDSKIQVPQKSVKSIHIISRKTDEFI